MRSSIASRYLRKLQRKPQELVRAVEKKRSGDCGQVDSSRDEDGATPAQMAGWKKHHEKPIWIVNPRHMEGLGFVI